MTAINGPVAPLLPRSPIIEIMVARQTDPSALLGPTALAAMAKLRLTFIWKVVRFAVALAVTEVIVTFSKSLVAYVQDKAKAPSRLKESMALMVATVAKVPTVSSLLTPIGILVPSA